MHGIQAIGEVSSLKVEKIYTLSSRPVMPIDCVFFENCPALWYQQLYI